ncbi:phage portal protein [Ralstonia solanacearum]|nr:phage portal protein [Ralstonia solanacearum FJAT-1458]QKL72124.1 phage portal protein [Ralstonia solanacearum]QKL77329.1 phage portal protein [Ralstonia solanacearum]QKL82535.1 phage portal protein [Ralstonia solanacearum]QKL87745.1 phage portal protein [Ralstonia solanacearum]
MGWLGFLQPRKRPKGATGAVAIGAPGAAGFVKEPFTGAWQQNQTLTTRDGMLASSAVFSCVDLISSDVAKLRIKSVRLQDGVWQEYSAPRFTSVLRKPNPYQTRLQFFKNWLSSKLTHGNAYILLSRNSSGAVVQMDVLNPRYVVPLVAPDGSVFYQCTVSPLQVSPMESVVFPARDVIHDRGITSWHPLIGMTPIAACAASATLASAISINSAAFFSNAARPSGILSAPGAISDATAARLKQQIEQGYSGNNAGKLLVAGDDLKYSAMTMTGADAQTIEQLKWTAEDVARCFHVPGHKIGLDTGARTANSSAIYESMYYSDCLQYYLEAVEQLLDDAFSVPDLTGLRFDLTGLMRMDETARHAANAQAVGAGYMAPNEARATVGLPPKPGGDTPYLQQQNYSLAALAARDANDPFAQDAAANSQADQPEEPADSTEEDTEDATT